MAHAIATQRYLAYGIYAGLITVAVVPATAAQNVSAAPHIRSDSPRVVDAMARGTRNSATFRRLVETIDATDGLVYIVEGSCPRGVRACLLRQVTVAGSNRVLRIAVNVRKAPGCELVEAIGHELQHAIEVLENARIRTAIQVYNLFDMVGRKGSGRFETVAALEVGMVVAREGCSAR